jgi:hypothetical protein
MLWYIKAIAEVTRYGENKDIEESTYNTIFELVGEVSEEALRRLDLSLEAMREIEERNIEAKKAPHARKRYHAGIGLCGTGEIRRSARTARNLAGVPSARREGNGERRGVTL